MFMAHKRWMLWIGFLGFAAPAAHAQFAVIDVGAIAQMVQEIATLEQQLQTAQALLAQANSEFAAQTGTRGMQNLLNGVPRNYLPASWDQLQGVMQGASGGYGALSSSLQGLLTGNAVLSPEQTATLSSAQWALLNQARQNVALSQALSRRALTNSSDRFAQIQQLINAISTAQDQKGILDLQARIAAEQSMLQNEHSKLEALSQTLQAEGRALQQRIREQSVADIGSFRKLPPLGL